MPVNKRTENNNYCFIFSYNPIILRPKTIAQNEGMNLFSIAKLCDKTTPFWSSNFIRWN